MFLASVGDFMPSLYRPSPFPPKNAGHQQRVRPLSRKFTLPRYASCLGWAVCVHALGGMTWRHVNCCRRSGTRSVCGASAAAAAGRALIAALVVLVAAVIPHIANAVDVVTVAAGSSNTCVITSASLPRRGRLCLRFLEPSTFHRFRCRLLCLCLCRHWRSAVRGWQHGQHGPDRRRHHH